MKVGIEALSFYTSRYYLDLHDLAKARTIDPNKYLEGLGQEKMAVLPPNEDIVTMSATAAKQALVGIDVKSISLVLAATESGVDQSKAYGIWVHDLLRLPTNCRVVELKQACYSGCAALMLAMSYVKEHPDKKVLILAADVARYGLQTPGEPTQGCGAVALVISNSPKLVHFEAESGCFTSSVMDFWRPNYREEALVDGKYSTKVYLSALVEAWTDYQNNSARKFQDHDRFCYHIPFTRMALKAHEKLAKLNDTETLASQIQDSLTYSKILGNSYSASLFIGLCSLLETTKEDLTGKRIGFFSYGSGCVAEFFSGIVQPDYQKALKTVVHNALLDSRTALTVAEYEAFYAFSLPTDGTDFSTPKCNSGAFCLSGISAHQRQYTQDA